MAVDYTPSFDPADVDSDYGSTGGDITVPTFSANMKPFRFWCQRALPLVYDDSLSYYEVLCKVVDQLNGFLTDLQTATGSITEFAQQFVVNQQFLNSMAEKLGQDVDALEDYINDRMEDFTAAYQQLQSYVNNYFDNLDVQQEINNKLDAMAADGTFNTLFNPIITAWMTAKTAQIDQDLSNQNQTIANQNSRISVLEGRMDTFASLPAGSTSGNAELLDIRTNFLGETFGSAGDAVRVSDLLASGFSSQPITYEWIGPTLGFGYFDITRYKGGKIAFIVNTAFDGIAEYGRLYIGNVMSEVDTIKLYPDSDTDPDHAHVSDYLDEYQEKILTSDSEASRILVTFSIPATSPYLYIGTSVSRGVVIAGLPQPDFIVYASNWIKTSIDTTLTQPGDAADAKATGDAIRLLDSRLENVEDAVEPMRINIADPNEPYVTGYIDVNHWASAAFIRVLPVRVKPNTRYTIMQKDPVSLTFRCGSSVEKPALNVPVTVSGSNDATSPKYITTGPNDQWIGVQYCNTNINDPSVYTPDTIMIAEGTYTEFIERSVLGVTPEMLTNGALDKINNDVVQPQIAETEAYQELVNGKQSLTADTVIDCYNDFVSGSVSYADGDVIVAASSRISSNHYIDLSNFNSVKIDPPSGYTAELVLFNQPSGAAYSHTGFAGTAKEYIIATAKYAKIILNKTSGTAIPSDAYGLTVLGIKSETNVSNNEKITVTGSAIKQNFVSNTDLHITAEEAATILVSNGNFLDPKYYDSSRTAYGITFTVNDDGSVTANGTATANADFYLRRASNPTIKHDGMPWYLSGNPGDYPTNDYFMYTTNHGDIGGGVVDDDTNITAVYIRIKNGVTVENLTFYPMLTIGLGSSGYIKGEVVEYTGTDIHANAFYGSNTQIASNKEISVTGYASTEDREVQNGNFGEFKKPYLMSMGHRGLYSEAPENTIYCFRKAVEADLDWMESDIQFTSDHVPVMFHDPTIDRVVTGHTGTIRDYTWAEVQTFDVSTYFQEAYPSKWEPEFANAKIMSLDEYIKFCKGVGKPTSLEIKTLDWTPEEIETVIDIIDKYRFEKNILWGGTLASVRGMYKILHRWPESTAVLVFDNQALTEELLTKLKLVNTGKNAYGVSIWNPTAEQIELLASKNIVIMQYMVDTLQQALAVDPVVTICLSNSINVRSVLKDYYMGN